jgi:hypothetical protein
MNGSYLFNNMGRISADVTDQSQRSVYNTRFANHTLSNYFSETMSDEHVKFATEEPTIMFSGTNLGFGLNGNVVDVDSELLIKNQQERSFERLQLLARPYLTVPYLGRGSCDPTLESQILQGEMISDKKSVSTIMNKSFSPYTLYPVDQNMQAHVDNPAYLIQEVALSGWVRGGNATRDMGDGYTASQSRPNVQY